MKRTILMGVFMLFGCGGYGAEQEYESAKSNGATHGKLCELAQSAADAYDGKDAGKQAQWASKAKMECALAELDGSARN